MKKSDGKVITIYSESWNLTEQDYRLAEKIADKTGRMVHVKARERLPRRIFNRLMGD